MIWEVIVVAALLVAAAVAVGIRFARAARSLTAPPGAASACGHECSGCSQGDSDPSAPAPEHLATDFVMPRTDARRPKSSPKAGD